MRGTRLRSAGKSVVAIISAVCFLTMSLGAVSRAVAADSWETWPRKTAEPVMDQKPAKAPDGAAGTWKIWPKKTAEPEIDRKPAADAEAAKAGDSTEKKTATGRSYGKIGWIALGIAVAIGVGIAAAGGGGDSGSAVVTNPGHQ